jgi:hypothetical protein
LTDPPFGVLDNGRDDFPQDGMQLLIRMAESYLKKGGTLLLFCAIDQVSIYKQFLKETMLIVEPLLLNIINKSNCSIILMIFQISKLFQKCK